MQILDERIKMIRLTDRHGILKKLGIDAAKLPTLEPCSNCRGEEYVDINLELMRMRFYVWCACGNSSNGYSRITLSISHWNMTNRNRRREQRK